MLSAEIFTLHTDINFVTSQISWWKLYLKIIVRFHHFVTGHFFPASPLPDLI